MAHCCSYNQLRLIRRYDKIDILPCCVAGIYNKIIKTVSVDEIRQVDDLYEYLNDIYKTGTPYPIYDVCKLYIDDPTMTECRWNDGKLSALDMSLTESCNLTCNMCRNSILRNADDDDFYYSCLERIKGHGLNTLYLTAAGEPFLYKHRAIDYIKSLTINDTKCLHATTNLTLLNTSDIEELKRFNDESSIRINFDVSISGSNSEVYSKIHKNKLYDKVLENALCMHRLGLLEHVNYVVQPANIDDLFNAYEFWANLGVNFRPIPVSGPYGFETIEDRYNEFMKIYYNKK